MKKRTKRSAKPIFSFEAGTKQAALMIVGELAARGVSSSIGGSGGARPLVVAVAGGSVDGGPSEVFLWLKEKLGGVEVPDVDGAKKIYSAKSWLMWDGLAALNQDSDADIKIFVDIGRSGRVAGSLLRLLEDEDIKNVLGNCSDIFGFLKAAEAQDSGILDQRENADLVIKHEYRSNLKPWHSGLCDSELRPKFKLPDEGQLDFGNLAVEPMGRIYQSDEYIYHLAEDMTFDKFLRRRKSRGTEKTVLILTYRSLGLQPARLNNFETIIEPQTFNRLKSCCGAHVRVIKRRDIYALYGLHFFVERVVMADPLFLKKRYLGQFLKICLSKRLTIQQARAYWKLFSHFGWREKDAILTPYAKM